MNYSIALFKFYFFYISCCPLQVTWLASWTENVQGQTKYIMLNAASKLKGEKDWMKYETARQLHKHIRGIRENYREDWRSKEMKIRQRAVALYFIDKVCSVFSRCSVSTLTLLVGRQEGQKGR